MLKMCQIPHPSRRFLPLSLSPLLNLATLTTGLGIKPKWVHECMRYLQKACAKPIVPVANFVPNPLIFDPPRYK